MTEEARARYVKPGEAVAILPSLMHQDRRGFFWLFGGGSLPNERRGPAGEVAVVHVRGELEHHATSWGESYEGIRARMADAFSGQDAADAHEQAHRWDDDFQPMSASPPKAIVMVIDSPGGVVSGLNETVKALQKLRDEHPKIRVVAYCNEMAASAAYALACSCEKIIAPPSAIVGSIGVISTMVSQARRDEKEGFDVRLLTSGARKADGHPHVPLSDSALTVEQKRVDKLAMSFFAIAAKARRVSIDKIRALQAGIYLGKDAIGVKLVDEVKSLDDLIAAAAAGSGALAVPVGDKMNMDLKALIKRTEAAIAKERDPRKLAALAADLGAYERTLAAYKKTEKYVEETVKEEETSDAEEADEEASADDEEEASTESAEMPDEEDDDDDEDGGDEKKSSKASLAFRAAVESLTGQKGKRALGALHAHFRATADTAERVRKLEAEQKRSEKASLIASVRGKYCTRADAEWLAKQPLAIVKGYVDHAKTRGMIVNTDESALVKPKVAAKPGTEEALPADVRKTIDAVVASYSGDKKAMREKLVEAHVAEHNKQIDAALNGAGRY